MYEMSNFHRVVVGEVEALSISRASDVVWRDDQRMLDRLYVKKLSRFALEDFNDGICTEFCDISNMWCSMIHEIYVYFPCSRGGNDIHSMNRYSESVWQVGEQQSLDVGCDRVIGGNVVCRSRRGIIERHRRHPLGPSVWIRAGKV